VTADPQWTPDPADSHRREYVEMKTSIAWKNIATGVGLTMIALSAAPAAVCGSDEPSPGPPARRAPQFTVLNPEAQLPEVDTKSLSPRLSGFAGKTIVIFDNRGGYDKPMKGLADQLKPLLPSDTRFVYYTPTTTTWNAADQAKVPLGDAAIVGHAY
jgi:hypothetical protein